MRDVEEQDVRGTARRCRRARAAAARSLAGRGLGHGVGARRNAFAHAPRRDSGGIVCRSVGRTCGGRNQPRGELSPLGNARGGGAAFHDGGTCRLRFGGGTARVRPYARVLQTAHRAGRGARAPFGSRSDCLLRVRRRTARREHLDEYRHGIARDRPAMGARAAHRVLGGAHGGAEGGA